MGFGHGRILEPALGLGHFIGLMPNERHARSHITGIEIDSITVRWRESFNGLGCPAAVLGYCRLTRPISAAAPSKVEDTSTMTAPLGKSVAAAMRKPPRPLTAPNIADSSSTQRQPRAT